MRPLALSIRNALSPFRLGPAAVGVGLAVLMAAMIWPGVPAVAAMALVTLGATTLTISRFRGSASMLPIMLMHFLVYGGLYVLLVCATLHAATLHQPPRFYHLLLADLAISVCPVAVALKLVWCELRMNILAE